MTTHSSVLAWRIPGTAEPGGLPSMGSHRVGQRDQQKEAPLPGDAASRDVGGCPGRMGQCAEGKHGSPRLEDAGLTPVPPGLASLCKLPFLYLLSSEEMLHH